MLLVLISIRFVMIDLILAKVFESVGWHTYFLKHWLYRYVKQMVRSTYVYVSILMTYLSCDLVTCQNRLNGVKRKEGGVDKAIEATTKEMGFLSDVLKDYLREGDGETDVDYTDVGIKFDDGYKDGNSLRNNDVNASENDANTDTITGRILAFLNDEPEREKRDHSRHDPSPNAPSPSPTPDHVYDGGDYGGYDDYAARYHYYSYRQEEEEAEPALTECYTCHYSIIDHHVQGMPNCAEPFKADGIPTVFCDGRCARTKTIVGQYDFMLIRSCLPNCKTIKDPYSTVQCCAGNKCNGAKNSAAGITSFTPKTKDYYHVILISIVAIIICQIFTDSYLLTKCLDCL